MVRRPADPARDCGCPRLRHLAAGDGCLRARAGARQAPIQKLLRNIHQDQIQIGQRAHLRADYHHSPRQGSIGYAEKRVSEILHGVLRNSIAMASMLRHSPARPFTFL